MGLYHSKAKKAAEDAALEEDRNFLAAEADGQGEKPDEGTSAVNVEYNSNAEADEVTEDGYF